jgi:cytoskeletal protein RodZ
MSRVHLVDAQHGWVSEAPVGSTAVLGEWLKQARCARGLTIDAISAQTKIPTHHLEALENGTSQLPPFYQRAEVRAFAHAVGVDEQLAITRYDAAVAPPEPEAAAVPAAAPALASTVNWRSPHVPLVIGIAVLAFALGRNTAERPNATVDAATQQSVAATPAPSTIAVTAPVQATSTPAPQVEPRIDAAAPAEVPTPVPVVTEAALVVSSQPAGARVTVNGIGWGTTPVTIRHLDPGAKRVRLTMDGYASTERTVVLGDTGRSAVNVRLTAAQ